MRTKEITMPSLAAHTKATLIPVLRYRDAPAAIEWLCATFGFEKHLVVPGDNGSVAHAQLSFGNGMVMLGSVDNESPFGRLMKQPSEDRRRQHAIDLCRRHRCRRDMRPRQERWRQDRHGDPRRRLTVAAVSHAMTSKGTCGASAPMTLGHSEAPELVRVQMKPRTLLRTASVLTLVHALLNAFAGLLSGTSKAPDETALLNAMKVLRFDAMGSMRTYWDFYFGFGVFLSANLILLSALMWQLAALAETVSGSARPFMALLSIGFLVFAALSSLYFFVAPVVIEVIIAVVLGLAYVAARR
jgi:hypothetical protein